MYQLVCELAAARSGAKSLKYEIGSPSTIIRVKSARRSSACALSNGDDVEGGKKEEVSPEGKSRLKKFSSHLKEILEQKIFHGGRSGDWHGLSGEIETKLNLMDEGSMPSLGDGITHLRNKVAELTAENEELKRKNENHISNIGAMEEKLQKYTRNAADLYDHEENKVDELEEKVKNLNYQLVEQHNISEDLEKQLVLEKNKSMTTRKVATRTRMEHRYNTLTPEGLLAKIYPNNERLLLKQKAYEQQLDELRRDIRDHENMDAEIQELKQTLSHAKQRLHNRKINERESYVKELKIRKLLSKAKTKILDVMRLVANKMQFWIMLQGTFEQTLRETKLKHEVEVQKLKAELAAKEYPKSPEKRAPGDEVTGFGMVVVLSLTLPLLVSSSLSGALKAEKIQSLQNQLSKTKLLLKREKSELTKTRQQTKLELRKKEIACEARICKLVQDHTEKITKMKREMNGVQQDAQDQIDFAFKEIGRLKKERSKWKYKAISNAKNILRTPQSADRKDGSLSPKVKAKTGESRRRRSFTPQSRGPIGLGKQYPKQQFHFHWNVEVASILYAG
eukprot:jgi/Bigna1/128292/aug1.6_g3000